MVIFIKVYASALSKMQRKTKYYIVVTKESTLKISSK